MYQSSGKARISYSLSSSGSDKANPLPPLLLRNVPIVTSTKAGAKRSILDESQLVRGYESLGSNDWIPSVITKQACAPEKGGDFPRVSRTGIGRRKKSF